MHANAVISDALHQKPDMILFYNKTKAGVDRMDQMSQDIRHNGEHPDGR